MALFFTADTHFGDHRTINIHRRPFADVAAMETALMAGWNEMIGPEDEIWHLGDVACRSADVPALLARLNGTKHSSAATMTIPRPAKPPAGRAFRTMPN